MTATNEIKTEQKIEELFCLAEKIFHQTFPRPSIYYNLDGRQIGRASVKKNNISFNPYFYFIAPDHIYNNTIPHEVAHLIAYYVYGKAGWGHTHFWKSIAKKLGIEETPKACSDILSCAKTIKLKPIKY